MIAKKTCMVVKVHLNTLLDMIVYAYVRYFKYSKYIN